MTRLFPNSVIGIGIREIRMTHVTRHKLFGSMRKLAFELIHDYSGPIKIDWLRFVRCDKLHGYKIRPISRNCCAVLLPLRLTPWPEEFRGRYKVHFGEYGLCFVDLAGDKYES